MNDPMGNRLKEIEMQEAGRKFIPTLPIIARLDGRSFSSFTRGLERPFDKRLSDLMVATTKYLVEETCADCGYTQSDEITLGWYYGELEPMFGGRISKFTSTLAAMCSVYFNHHLFDQKLKDKLPTFDCRVWNMPNLNEGANAFLWRELDATKNSISMAARHYYSHKELANKNSKEMQEMLFQKGINWNDYPSFFKRGTYVQRKLTVRKFTTEEIDILPKKHAARTNPELTVERHDVGILDLPPLLKVINRVGVIFKGEDYVTSEPGV